MSLCSLSTLFTSTLTFNFDFYLIFNSFRRACEDYDVLIKKYAQKLAEHVSSACSKLACRSNTGSNRKGMKEGNEEAKEEVKKLKFYYIGFVEMRELIVCVGIS